MPIVMEVYDRKFTDLVELLEYVKEKDKEASMKQTKQFNRGDQVVAIPDHIKNKPDKYGLIEGAQYGFVTSGPNNHGGYFVRYWLPGNRENPELRTKANSESTPLRYLHPFPEYTAQENVIMALKEWC